MKQLIRTTKKRKHSNKKRKQSIKKTIGGGELEEFQKKYIGFIDAINKKLTENPEHSKDVDASHIETDNICFDLYNDDCKGIQELFSENRNFLSEDFVLHAIYGIGDDDAKYSLLYIYYDLLEDIRLSELYDKLTVVSSASSKEESEESKPITSSSSVVTVKLPSIEELGTVLPDIQMQDYWISIINKIEKKKHDDKQQKYRESSRAPFVETAFIDKPLHKYRDTLKQMVNETPNEICNLLKENIKYYDVASDKYIEYNQKICLVLLIIGYLTNLLFKSDTCSIILKGGKAVQFYAPVPSDDIDITIAPKGDNPITNEQIEVIGNQIADLIIWVLTFVYSGSDSGTSGLKISKLVRGEGGSKIIKLSIQSVFGYLPIVDIGLGYNSFPEKIKQLNNVKTIDETPYYLKTGLSKKLPNYGFCHVDLGSIITEKLYYILQYLNTCDHANSYYRNKSYYNLIKYLEELIKQHPLGFIQKTFKKSLKNVITFRINERDSILDILYNITRGMFINRWFIIDRDGLSRGLFPDVHVMCLPDDTMIQLNGWGNNYTTVYNQFKTSVPKLSVPESILKKSSRKQ